MIDNITLYKSFVEVANCGSISAAARKLYVTQPAVSSEIIQLETILGIKLFFRTSRGINLTPEGKLLFEYVKSAFSFLEVGEDKLRNITGLSSGTLRIGASDMTLKFFLLDYLEIFHNNYPKIKLSVTNAPTPLTLIALKSGQIDFGVISEPVEKNDRDIEYIELRDINDIIVCSEKYDIYKKEQIDIEELSQYPLIMLERETSTRKYVESQLKLNGISEDLFEPDIELATSDLILEFAKRGIGIACIVEDFALKDIESGKLKKINLKKPFPSRKFLLAYLKKTSLSAASKYFIENVLSL